MVKWSNLTPQQQAQFGNGVGPWWFPALLRIPLTRLSSFFFQEADWARHDFGYRNETAPRRICDLRFLQAMLRDASRTASPLKILGACALAWLFWIAVRLGGWASYGHKP